MYINVQSNDGNGHDVQVYADVTGGTYACSLTRTILTMLPLIATEWLTGDGDTESSWSINEATDLVYLQMQLTDPIPYAENLARPLDGTLYHAMQKANDNLCYYGVYTDKVL